MQVKAQVQRSREGACRMTIRRDRRCASESADQAYPFRGLVKSETPRSVCGHFTCARPNHASAAFLSVCILFGLFCRRPVIHRRIVRFDRYSSACDGFIDALKINTWAQQSCLQTTSHRSHHIVELHVWWWWWLACVDGHVVPFHGLPLPSQL